MMNFTEYTNNVLRTWNTTEPQLANAALGLVGEVNEWLNDGGMSRGDELGDVWYYTAVLCHLCGVEPTYAHFDPYNSLTTRRLLFYRLGGDVAEAVKKVTFHDKAIVRVNEPLLKFVGELDRHTLDPSETWAENIAKLKARHPGGWSAVYSDKDREDALRAFAAREAGV